MRLKFFCQNCGKEIDGEGYSFGISVVPCSCRQPEPPKTERDVVCDEIIEFMEESWLLAPNEKSFYIVMKNKIKEIRNKQKGQQ